MRTLALNATPFVYRNDNTRLRKTDGGVVTHYNWNLNRPSGPSPLALNRIANNLEANGFSLGGYSIPYLKAQYISGGTVHYYNPEPSPITFTFTYDETQPLSMLEDDLFWNTPPRTYNRDSIPVLFTLAPPGAAQTSYETWQAGGFGNIYEGSFWAYEAYLDVRLLEITDSDLNACRPVNADRSATISVPTANNSQLAVSHPLGFTHSQAHNPVSVVGYRWYWGDGSAPTSGGATETHTFDEDTTGVYVVGIDNFGREVGRNFTQLTSPGNFANFRHGPFKLAPRAVIRAKEDDDELDLNEPIETDTVTLDGSESFDLDGTISSYLWYVGEPGQTGTLFPGTFQGSGATLPYQFPGDGEYEVILDVRDGLSGSFCSHQKKTTVTVEASPPSIISDSDGVTYAAVKNSTNVEVREFKNGLPSKRVLATIENHDNPVIYRHPDTSTLYIKARDKADGENKIYQSNEFGRSWEFMANAPFGGAGWKRASRACDLPDGEHGVAAVKSDGSKEVWFARGDANFNFGDPVFVGVIEGNNLNIDVYSEKDSSRVTISNADDFMMISDCYGDEGSWL